MKKFISIVIAAAMLLSFCVVAVSAETASTLTINVYSEPYSGTPAPEKGTYKPESYDVYRVYYTVSGIDPEVDKTTALTIYFDVDDETKVAAKSWSKSVTSPPAKKDSNGFVSVLGSVISSSHGYAWADPDGIAVDYSYNYSGGVEDSNIYADTLIYVTAGETVTFTYDTVQPEGGQATSKIVVDTWDNDNNRVFNNSSLQYKINGTVGNTLTLGDIPTTYTIGFQDKDGTAIGTAATYNAGDTVTPPTAPTVPGYTFAYWSTDGINNDFSSTAVADATYKAVYTKDAVPATKVTISGAAKAKVGATVALEAVVEPEGSDTPIATFTGTGVTDGKDNTATVTSATAGDVVVTATAGEASTTFTVTFIEDAPAVLTNKTPLAVKDAKIVEASTEGAESIYVTKAAFTPDFTNFIYKAWAREDGSEERHYFDQTINSKLGGKIEGSGAFDFILMIKSATHKIVDCGIETFIQ